MGMLISKDKYSYKITREWLDIHNFHYDSLIVVDSIDQKLHYLTNNRCDLFIDDLSWGQNLVGSYTRLYDNFIDKLNQNKIVYEIFNYSKNNWQHISEKYIDK